MKLIYSIIFIGLFLNLVKAQNCGTPLYNTPAISNPVFLNDMEAELIGGLPSGWSHSGGGSAFVTNLDNYTLGGTKSVCLEALSGTTSKVVITNLSPSTTGNLFSYRTTGLFGQQGQFTITYFGTISGNPNTVLMIHSINLLNGISVHDFPDGSQCSSTLAAGEINQWCKQDIDISPDGPVFTDNKPRVCQHTGSQTIWLRSNNPLLGIQNIDKIEISLQSTGGSDLKAYFDDFKTYESLIVTAATPIPTLPQWGLIIFAFLLISSSMIYLIRR